jgi:Uma2 family endonuclease
MVIATRPLPAATADRSDWTWDEFVALPDDDKRELVFGKLLEVDVPTELHEHLVIAIGAELYNWSRTHGGRVLASGYKVKVSGRSGVMPDVQWYRPGRVVPQAALDEGAPDLAVEVISPTSGRYDRLTKLEWYRQIGTGEYWIVDPETRSIQAFVLHGGHWLLRDQVALPEPGEPVPDAPVVFRPASFAGLELELERLFAVPEAGGAATS